MLLKQRFSYIKRIEKYINLTINILSEQNILKIKGPLGIIKFGFSNKEMKFINNNADFILKSSKKNIFFKNLRESIRGVLVPWIQHFEITGYQYNMDFSYLQDKFGLSLGFTYWVIINLTKDNVLYLNLTKGKKFKKRTISRKFTLTGINYEDFKELRNYLNTVRSLLPYKLKGLTFPESKKNIKLKIGKKVKYR